MGNKKLYLETTIPITSIIGNKSEKDKINSIKSEFAELCSSSYVKMEFKRTIMQSLIYLNNICYQENSFSNIMERIRKLGKQKNKMQRVMESLVQFFADFEKTKCSFNELGREYNEIIIEKIKDYLSSIIPLAEDVFSEVLLSDKTECALAKIEPQNVNEIYKLRLPECDKSRVKCKIVDFVKSNEESFRKIYNKIKSLSNIDEEQQKIKNILKNILSHPENIANQKYCWDFGDPIIAVECPIDADLYTTNLKHFQPLCDSIDRKLVNK